MMCNRYEILKLVGVALDFSKSKKFCLIFYATLFFIATILLFCKTKLSPVYDENVGLCLQALLKPIAKILLKKNEGILILPSILSLLIIATGVNFYTGI